MADAPAPAAHAKTGTVKLPLLGNVNKKTLAIGAVVAGGVLAYFYIRRAHAASGTGTATSAGTTAADPNLDPATGFDYGTPQDIQALDASAGSANLGFGSGIGLGNGVPAGGQFFDPNAPAPATVTTNAEWEQEAIANLEAGGVSQATVRNAESGLPRYLAHLALSAEQATAVRLAVGLTGPPPSGGPFAIRVAPSGHHPPPAAKVKVPGVTGRQYAAAREALEKAGFKVRAVPRGAGIVAFQDPAAGAEADKGSAVTLHMAATG